MGFNIKIGDKEFYYTWTEILYGSLIIIAAFLVFLGFFYEVFSPESSESTVLDVSQKLDNP
ncbi:MAG: hypothetical protein ACI857_001776 [Arenicella sp.]|jgi:hypothetical protein